jgi:chromosome segregation ATPase
MSQPDPIPTDERPVWEMVIDDMKARDHLGRERYGTPLQVSNGRDALRDAYEEVLDLAVYLRQERVRRQMLLDELAAAKDEILSLKAECDRLRLKVAEGLTQGIQH